jgi:Ca2+-binding EF-hand superfamily protein
MKFTFKSEHQFGTTVEMSFDEEHIDEIEEMFKLFLRGSGFHIQDEDMYTKEENSDTSEECVHASDKKPWVGLTDEEIKNIMQRWRNGYIDIKDVEQLLKERNI